uniref:Cytosolic fatty-acid binding proteins domain-containing protein n=1 Tax=Electrophorus electricus TaxID=8005 RepID=A0A4W4HA03_ELEEL
MPASLCCTWDLLSNTNFEGYMIALGVSLYTRKIALKLKQCKVTEQGADVYVIKTLSALRNYVLSFKVDEEFDEFTKEMMKPVSLQSLVTWKGKKQVCTQNGERRTEPGHTGSRTTNYTWYEYDLQFIF